MKSPTLESMFHKYHEVRVGLGSARTSAPDPEALNVQDKSSQKSKESLEGRKAFVADVKIYLNSLHWCDAIVLMSQMRPADEKPRMWTKIVSRISKITGSRKVDFHYRYPNHMSIRYWDKIYPHAEDYFRRSGYLR